MSEWTRPAQPVRCVVELDKPLAVHRERGVLAQGDANANAIVAEVYSTAGKPYDLSGCTMQLIFVRPDNNVLPALNAEISGNTATATLPDSAYAMSGMYSLRMQMRKNGAERTIVWIIGEVKGTDVDGIADPEHVISIGDIMASAKEAQTAASAANAAAQRANAGAERVEQLQIDASGLAGDSNNLDGKPASYYLPAVNLLDNGDFAIAQAGYGGYHGAELYAADRWFVSHGKNGFAVSRSNGVTSFESTKAQICIVQQFLSDYALKYIKPGDAYTIAICMSDGTIKTITDIYSLTGESDYDGADVDTGTGFYVDLYCYVGGRPTVRIFATGIASINFQWVNIFPGTYTAETMPPLVPRPYAVELAECQRYYYQSEMPNASTFWDGCVYFTCSSGYSNPTNIFFPTEMRKKPSINIYYDANKTNGVIRWDNDVAVGDVVPVYYTNKGFNVAFASGGAEIGKGYAFHYTASADL